MTPPLAPQLPGTVTEMRTNHPVPLLQKAKTYELWKKQVNIWLELTDMKEEKRGMTIALALPEECDFGKNINSSVLEHVSLTDMKKKEGHKKVLEYLDEILG